MGRTKFRSIRRRKKRFIGKKSTEETRPRQHSNLTIPRASQVVEDHQGQNDSVEADIVSQPESPMINEPVQEPNPGPANPDDSFTSTVS